MANSFDDPDAFDFDSWGDEDYRVDMLEPPQENLDSGPWLEEDSIAPSATEPPVVTGNSDSMFWVDKDWVFAENKYGGHLREFCNKPKPLCKPPHGTVPGKDGAPYRPSAYFCGALCNYIFTTRGGTTGYYIDATSEVQASVNKVSIVLDDIVKSSKQYIYREAAESTLAPGGCLKWHKNRRRRRNPEGKRYRTRSKRTLAADFSSLDFVGSTELESLEWKKSGTVGNRFVQLELLDLGQEVDTS